jgi:hypothetical protein
MAFSRAHSDTLVVDEVTSVNFPQYFANITVIHRGTTGTIWLRTDGVAPVILADDNFPVMPGQSRTYPNGILTQEPITRTINGSNVQLISDTAVPFTVYVS